MSRGFSHLRDFLQESDGGGQRNMRRPFEKGLAKTFAGSEARKRRGGRGGKDAGAAGGKALRGEGTGWAAGETMPLRRRGAGKTLSAASGHEGRSAQHRGAKDAQCSIGARSSRQSVGMARMRKTVTVMLTALSCSSSRKLRRPVVTSHSSAPMARPAATHTR